MNQILRDIILGSYGQLFGKILLIGNQPLKQVKQNEYFSIVEFGTRVVEEPTVRYDNRAS